MEENKTEKRLDFIREKITEIKISNVIKESWDIRRLHLNY